MLEALGTTAALVEILKLLRGGIELCQSFREAPHELQQLASHFKLLSTEVELFLIVSRGSRDWLHGNRRDVQLLNQYIANAGKALYNIQSALTNEVREATFKNRLRWSLYGKVKADSLLQRLARLESSMNVVMGLVSRIKLDRIPMVKLESRLSQLVARAKAINAHRLRSGRPSQVPSILACSVDSGSLACLHLATRDSQQGMWDASRANEVVPRLTTASRNASPSYNAQLARPSGILCQLRLKSWLMQAGQSPRTGSSGDLVTCEVPVMEAAREGNVQAMRRILRRDCRAKNCATIDKLTPIGLAIQYGQLAVVQLLLEKKVELNAKFGRFEITALAQALRCRQFDIAKFLIGRGASFSSRNISGWSPLFNLWDAEVNPPASQYIDLLQKRRDFHLLHDGVYDLDGWGAIHRAACFGTANDVELLISLGLDPFDRIRHCQEETECASWTVLHVAVWYAALNSVKVLCSHYVTGPGIDITDDDGCTPLHLAILREQLGIAAILLRYGADPLRKTTVAWPCKANDTGGRRYNAIMLAAEVGRDFQQQFGALISEKVRALDPTRSNRQSRLKADCVATTGQIFESKQALDHGTTVQHLIVRRSSVGKVQLGRGCMRKFWLAVWLLISLVAFKFTRI